MRCLFLILLLVLPLLGYAGDTRNTTKTPVIREVVQAAVIRVQPGSATIDSYLAIAGVPYGQTITCVLPFQQQPDGFYAESMSGRQYARQYEGPAHGEVKAQYDSISGSASRNYLLASTCVGSVCAVTPLVGAMVFPVFAKAREKARCSSTPPFTNRMVEPPRTEIKLVYCGRSGAQTGTDGVPLPLPADLPAPYCAVLQLTNLSRQANVDPIGIHCHVRHRLAGDTVSYLQPRYLGATVQQHTILTDLNVIAPPTSMLSVDAPSVGQQANYDVIMALSRFLFESPADPAQGDDAVVLDLIAGSLAESRDDANTHPAQQTDSVSAMGSLLREQVKYPSSWNRVYLHSDTRQGVRIRILKHPQGWRVRLALWAMSWPFSLGLSFCVFCVAWVLAGRVVLYPHWKRLGQPGRYWLHFSRVAVPITALLVICSIPFVAAFLVGIVNVHGDANDIWWAFLVGLVIAAGLLAIYRMVMRRFPPSLLSESRALSWGAMALIYTGLTAVIAVIIG